MIFFANLDQPMTGLAYDQMDNMLGHLKDIIELINVKSCDYILHRVGRMVGEVKFSN